jgi:hypothetical protein
MSPLTQGTKTYISVCNWCYERMETNMDKTENAAQGEAGKT